MDKKITRPAAGIIGILIIVGLLVAGLVYSQNRYSNKLKSISVEVYSPPIEGGQILQKIVITKDGCSEVVTNIDNNEVKYPECSVLKGGFGKIQEDANKYSLTDKLQTPSLKSLEDIKKGGVYNVTAELNNGDKYSLELDSQFVSTMQPFFKNLQLYAPNLSSYGLVEQSISS